MENEDYKIIKERRRSPDKWVYISRLFAVISWLLFIIALIVSFYAAPEENYGYLRYGDIAIRDYWIKPLANYLYITLWLSAFFSFVCLIITNYRSRRHLDSKKFNLVLLIITSAAWLTYLYVQINHN